MSVIIGIDPHKALHAACAIDRTREPSSLRLQRAHRPASGQQLLRVGGTVRVSDVGDRVRRRARLSARPAARRRGEHVVDVPATLSSRVRVLGSGRSNKNDANDARAVAIAALRSPSLHAGPRRGPRHGAAAVGQGARSTRQPGASPRLQPAPRAGARAGRRAGSARKSLSRRQISSSPTIAAGRTRRSVNASSSPTRCSTTSACLDAKLKRSKARITDAVTASATTLTEIFGVGPIIAAMRHRLHRRRPPGSRPPGTSPRTTAPPRSSSAPPGRTVHRLSRRGNRTLNHAIHMIAVTQIRHPDSEGRALLRPQARRGPHTPRSDARVEAPHQRPRLPPPHADDARSK